MKKTFTTVMPDQIGAFLRATQCLSQLGLNITRVSYNKAVDTHMLFIEVEGEEAELQVAQEELEALGYLNDRGSGNVILIEFQLRDEPGALLPVLQLIHQYAFNISFISSRETGGEYQFFKMGLFVENGRLISAFMRRAAALCPIRVLEYDESEQILDNTVFYVSFAGKIAEKLGLGAEEKQQLLLCSNLIMQMLEERSQPPHKTFEYIGAFADQLLSYRGEAYRPRITHQETVSGLPLLLIEPPCGSNTCVITCQDGTLLFVDSGFACYGDELWACLAREIPDFAARRKELLLTHADVDHTGCVDRFDRVYLSRASYESFLRERQDLGALREENPTHAPYVRISKLLSGYRTPRTAAFTVVGEAADCDRPLCPVGELTVHGLHFRLFEGQGGHVAGELIFVEDRERLVFTGDIFVNIRGFSREQAAFNRLAPYLMTSVDTDPALAKAEREELRRILPAGRWTVCSGHGALLEQE